MFPYIYNNTWITDDKVLHFIFSFIVSILIWNFLTNKNNKKFKLIITILIIWLIKEFLDKFYLFWNVEVLDLITNFLGMGFFLLLIKIKYIIFNKK